MLRDEGAARRHSLAPELLSICKVDGQVDDIVPGGAGAFDCAKDMTERGRHLLAHVANPDDPILADGRPSGHAQRSASGGHDSMCDSNPCVFRYEARHRTHVGFHGFRKFEILLFHRKPFSLPLLIIQGFAWTAFLTRSALLPRM